MTEQALVVGAGTMGTGIAYVLALSGHEVTLVEPDPDRAAVALRDVDRAARKAAERGKLDPAVDLAGRIVTVSTLDQVSGRPAVAVEAVPERVALKHEVLAAIEALEPALLGSNTSGLPIGDLAAPLARPDRFLGLHFFNPVWSMPLVEIVVGSQTADSSVQAARALVGSFGKESIVVRDTPGFATSRLGLAIGLEAMRMLEEGVASASDIDKAMSLGYRHPMGPLRLSDLVGLDVRLDIASHLAASLGPRFAPPAILRSLVASGRLGKKSGRGFYEWDEG